MNGDILVPPLGESISEATLSRWLKGKGEFVQADEPLVELETDKVTLEVNAPVSGYVGEVFAEQGSVVAVGALLGRMQLRPFEEKSESVAVSSPPMPTGVQTSLMPLSNPSLSDVPLSPAVRKMVQDHQLDPSQIPASGKDGRLTKGDVLQFLAQPQPSSVSVETGAEPVKEAVEVQRMPEEGVHVVVEDPIKESIRQKEEPMKEERKEGALETRVPMSRLRQRIAQRLKEAQNTAAILTTFNEVDMSAIMDLRERYKDLFEKKHGVRLGMMSFFVKAAVEALKEFPAVNAVIEGDEIVYKHTYDIGVAVGTEQGLVVPVIRRAESLSLADIERAIAAYGEKARTGQLKVDDLMGGTFTLSNGGVYGSLMSTPILNPPQSGILGMHKTQKRPVVDAQGHIVVKPMMYVALSYDHRIIDGKEAVSFLVRIKEKTEHPERVLLGL